MQYGQYGAPPQGAYDPNYMGQQQMYGQQPMYDPSQQPMYGQQPGYDPQMVALQQQDQAAAQLAQLEAMKKFKDEQEYQKALDHVVHQMRHGNRNQEDNASCATTICFWGIFNGLLWAVPLLGDNWWNKVWHGLGVRKLQMSLGLFNMWVMVDCDGYAQSMDGRLCKAWSKYGEKGTWALAEMRDQMCHAVPGKCPVMQRVVQSGYAPLYGLPLAAAFEVISVLLLYFYWHGKPSALARNLGVKFAAAAPFIGNLSFFFWLFWCPYMHELPRIWAEEGGSNDFASSTFFGMKESFTMPFGWCSIMVVVAVMFSTARYFVQWGLPFHIHEPNPYGVGDDGVEAELRRQAEKVIAQGLA